MLITLLLIAICIFIFCRPLVSAVNDYSSAVETHARKTDILCGIKATKQVSKQLNKLDEADVLIGQKYHFLKKEK